MQERRVPGTIQRIAALKRTITSLAAPAKKEGDRFADAVMLLRAATVREKKGCLHLAANCIAHNKFFTNYFIPAIIFMNTGILSAERYPQDPRESNILELVNFFFYFVFCFEIIVKLKALGCKGYFHDGYNVLDSILLAISSVDTAIKIYLLVLNEPTDSPRSQAMHEVLSAFRAFRLLRIFKLASTW